MVDKRSKSDLVIAKTAIGKEDEKILFASRFKHQMGKSDKGEIRILAITPYRLYVITPAKTPKIDISFHILEIYSLEGIKSMSPSPNDTYLFQLSVTIQVGEKHVAHRFLFEHEEYVGTVVSFIIALLRTNFNNASIDKHVSWKLASSENQEVVEASINNLSKALSGEGQACGGFSLAYLCICDYYKQISDHNAEVCWDIDKIYASHGCKDFKLDDFDRLDAKDLVPLIATLAYNTWFTRLVVSSLKLSNEIIEVIVKVIRRTLSIEEIILEDCHLNKEQVQKISLAFATNPNKIIKRVNLSKNHMEDKSISNLCGTFGTMPNGLEMMNLSEVGMTNKGATHVVNCLKQNKLMSSTLAVLNLSGNPLKLEGIQSLCDFFSQPNALTDIVLSNTECPLDLLFTAIHRGCQLSLENLDLSGNLFFGKKSSKDASVNNSLSSLQQFFSMSRALKNVNLSSTKIPPSAVKAVLVGLLNNPMLTDIALDLSSNELKSNGAEELKSCLKEIQLSTLNLSNNGLEQDLIPLCEALQNNHNIKELDLSQNVNKAKNISAIADAMSNILEAETPLMKLFVADNKLRVHAGLLFDAIGTNETLVSLDISGNAVGDEGARMLAKALQINTKLQEILMDRNNVTSKGLQDIAQSMDRNYSLRSLTLPVVDLAVAMKANTNTAFLKSYGVIEQAMIRNQCSKQSTPEQAYKVHQGLLMTSIDHYTHHIDEYVIQLEDTISKVKLSANAQLQEEIKTAVTLIKEAELFRQVVLELYSDPEHSKGLLDNMFNKVTEDIVNSVESVIKDNIDKMLRSATNICPIALNKEGSLKVIKDELLNDDALIEKSAISDSIMQLGRSEITYRLCESNLLTATNIAEHLKKLFVDALQNSINSLNSLYDDQVSEAISVTEQQNIKVNGQLENIKIQTDDLEDEVIIPPISTPAFNLLNNISNENTFDLSWEFTKDGSAKRDTLSSVQSDTSDDSNSFNIETCRRRLNTDSAYQGRKKKKTCSLKRRPTFYKESNEVHEVEIDIDSSERKPSLIEASLKKSTDQVLHAEPESVPQIQVNVPEYISAAFSEQNMLTERSKSVDSDDNHTPRDDSALSTASSSSVLSTSLSIEDTVDGEDTTLDAFDDVSNQSSQLSVNKKRVKPQQGRRAPTRVSKLAHMKADDDDLLTEGALKPVSKPRPKSEVPIGNPLFDEVTRPRLGTEKLKREPPARPSPPTPSSKMETPTRPDPPVTTPKGEAPVRPERPKKPELDKKPEPTKEKKVKPPSGAFQLPALPSLGGMLKKRTAPKAPDTVDASPNKMEDGVDSERKEDTILPSIGDTDSSHSVDTPPTKPPPPSVIKRSSSPTPHDGAHSLEGSKSPEPNSSTEGATKPSPIKKPPRGIPMGGLGGSALMAEMNKKLQIAAKSDDEEHSPNKAAAVPPKPQKPTPPQAPQKPTPPQRPPSLKRSGTSTEGRPNVPDRPKALNKSSKSHESANENELTEAIESSDQPSNGGKSSEEAETSNDAELQEPVTAFV